MGGRHKAADEGALGVVLAGGRGSRLGGAKPTAELAGRPLISYPLAALAEAGLDAAVVAKPVARVSDPLVDDSLSVDPLEPVWRGETGHAANIAGGLHHAMRRSASATSSSSTPTACS